MENYREIYKQGTVLEFHSTNSFLDGSTCVVNGIWGITMTDEILYYRTNRPHGSIFYIVKKNIFYETTLYSHIYSHILMTESCLRIPKNQSKVK